MKKMAKISKYDLEEKKVKKRMARLNRSLSESDEHSEEVSANEEEKVESVKKVVTNPMIKKSHILRVMKKLGINKKVADSRLIGTYFKEIEPLTKQKLNKNLSKNDYKKVLSYLKRKKKKFDLVDDVSVEKVEVEEEETKKNKSAGAFPVLPEMSASGKTKYIKEKEKAPVEGKKSVEEVEKTEEIEEEDEEEKRKRDEEVEEIKPINDDGVIKELDKKSIDHITKKAGGEENDKSDTEFDDWDVSKVGIDRKKGLFGRIKERIGFSKNEGGSVEKNEVEVEDVKDEKPIKRKVDKTRKNRRIKASREDIEKCTNNIDNIKKEMSKTLVGQEVVVDKLIMGLLCNAHVLVEGVPGIAKTLAIRTLGAVSGCTTKRIQFTVDLLPTDIIGITSYNPEKGFEIIKGPVFTNFLIADEINRSPPKTQSALIEAMQEHQVTIGREKYPLPSPFFVMATENPIEDTGVYPLPEAQIDRFLFKIIMGYPNKEEEKVVMESNMTLRKFESFDLKPIVTPEEIIWMQDVVKKVYLDDSVKNYILAIVRKTREKDFVGAEYVTYGSSPRASIGLYIASKARALIKGRNYVIPEDVRDVVFDILRHRIMLSYKAIIKKINEDSIIQEILNSVKVD